MGSHNEPQNMNLSLNPDLSLSRLAEDEAPPLPLPKDNSKKQEDGAINPWESIFNPQTTFKQNNRGSCLGCLQSFNLCHNSKHHAKSSLGILT
ncbi:hypothetical protein RO3G_00224 [Rhizopus delemar RA 99-880]|uniref:Uncharacterized protein n=1 Tax=Rhizopus delemar (strain RA 99-880 / ATCC MYA-4621 / FGSC 9543 / NRRL 43880) TaxID=246409 RepID=I1BH40_RHIO9|nr:hypothetical protein RO3G_00224 [Rhizopus delemar RA 99-880]|eukprot:EIE75520.1 hypothetical protein RO3G_00224 [Rhizopus delemar RA 99-880]